MLGAFETLRRRTCGRLGRCLLQPSGGFGQLVVDLGAELLPSLLGGTAEARLERPPCFRRKLLDPPGGLGETAGDRVLAGGTDAFLEPTALLGDLLAERLELSGARLVELAAQQLLGGGEAAFGAFAGGYLGALGGAGGNRLPLVLDGLE